MTTANIPHLRENAMATGAPKSEPKTAEPKTAPPRDLAPAGQSGEPEVQKLLADRQAHVLNLGEEDPQVAEQRRAARAAIAEIDKKLADLGYTAA